MPKICVICGKKSVTGISYARRGMAKKKGGAGQRITGKTKRRFKPNLQKIKIIIEGRIKRSFVCTSCIRSGKAKKVYSPARKSLT